MTRPSPSLDHPLRVFLSDNHAVLREGLQLLVNAQADMQVIGHAASGREAVERVCHSRPDVVVMDVSMPDLDGTVATELIRKACPQVRVLGLTRHSEESYLRRFLKAGASGYVLKRAAADELIQAIRVVAAGGTYIDSTMAPALVEKAVGLDARVTSGELTPRETDVVRRIARGFSNREIAADLGISVKTVEYHKSRAVEKHRFQGRADIVRYAIARGWLQDDDMTA